MKTKVHFKFLSVANSENKSALKSLVKPQLGSVKVRQNFYQNFHHMGDRILKILSPTDKIALISKWWNGYCNPSSRIIWGWKWPGVECGCRTLWSDWEMNITPSYTWLALCYKASFFQSSEVQTLTKEVEKQKELLSSSDVRIKWAQNKLKAELDAHKVPADL